MEAINFLVTSGECAIILGLARPYVEHFLGVAFKDLVQGMPPGLVGLDPAIEWKDAELDRTYAELYLEKLIQIEITIPKPTDAQASAIIVPRPRTVVAAQVLDEKVTSRILRRNAREASLRAVFRIIDRWTGPVLGTLVLASILTYTIAKWRFPVYERIDRALVTQEAKTNTSSTSTTLGGIKVQLGANNLVLSNSKDDATTTLNLPAKAPATAISRPKPSAVS